MSAPTIFEFAYDAEVKLAAWTESDKGAFIRLELPPIPVGEAHPFKGLNGQRFRMRFTPLIGDATLADAVANEAPVPADAPPFIGARTASVEGTPDAVPGRGRSEADKSLPEKMEEAAREPVPYEGLKSSKSEAGRDRYLQMDDGERAVARASIMAKDARFHAWVSKRGSCQDPPQFIRDWCRVKSRTEIASNMQAFERFLDLEHEVRGFAEQRG